MTLLQIAIERQKYFAQQQIANIVDASRLEAFDSVQSANFATAVAQVKLHIGSRSVASAAKRQAKTTSRTSCSRLTLMGSGACSIPYGQRPCYASRSRYSGEADASAICLKAKGVHTGPTLAAESCWPPSRERSSTPRCARDACPPFCE